MSKNKISDTFSSCAPIKVVDTDKKPAKIVRGNGLCTATVALLTLNAKQGGAKRVLRVLLDSGSDGDLFFHKKETRIDVKYQERYRRQTWTTSNGNFTTRYVGKIQVCFPDFLKMKTASFARTL